jgi:predicted transcriptional regulator
MQTINYLSFSVAILGVITSAISVYVAIKYGRRARRAEEEKQKTENIMGDFVSSIANQSQSVIDSLNSVLRMGASSDYQVARLEGIIPNMASLNGTIQRFYEKYYKNK